MGKNRETHLFRADSMIWTCLQATKLYTYIYSSIIFDQSKMGVSTIEI